MYAWLFLFTFLVGWVQDHPAVIGMMVMLVVAVGAAWLSHVKKW